MKEQDQKISQDDTTGSKNSTDINYKALAADSMNNNKSYYIKLAAFGLTLLVIILAEQLYKEPLSILSVDYIISTQTENKFESFWFFIARALQDLGEMEAFSIFTVLLSFFLSRVRIFYYMVSLSFSIYILNLFKLLYKDPRPYMANTEIINKNCSLSFGNPSGHSLLFASYTITLWLDYWKLKKEKSLASEENLRKKCPQYIQFVLVIGCQIIMCLSRVYDGTHSFNQVLFGWSFGLWIGLFFHYCLRDWLLNHFEFILKEKYPQYSAKYFQYLITSTLLYTVAIGINIYAFVNVKEDDIDKEWIIRISQKCSKFEKTSSFEYSVFMKSVCVTFAYSAYVSALTVENFVRLKGGYEVNDIQQIQITFKNILVKILCFIGTVLPLIIYFFSFQKKPDNYYQRYIFRQTLTFLLSGLLIFGGFCDLLVYRLISRYQRKEILTLHKENQENQKLLEQKAEQ